jgi:hypothetical protein
MKPHFLNHSGAHIPQYIQVTRYCVELSCLSGANSGLVWRRSSRHRDGAARPERNREQKCPTGPVSWQKWDKISNQVLESKGAENGNGAQGRNRTTDTVIFSHVRAILSPTCHPTVTPFNMLQKLVYQGLYA